MNEITVSVIVITYNHCQYIEKALDSILSQKTDFNYEILIGDDASSDGTSEIILNYQKRYPDMMIPFIREKNIGATKNDYDLKCHARGKYIAQLEGDDYWSDNYKLQKQVDFLEQHSEYIACSHQCYVVDDMGKRSAFSGLDWVNFEKSEYTIEDFCAWKTPGHTSAMVYRNIFSKYDCSILWKADSLVGDRTMALLLITHGRIYCMGEFMSCYRYIVQAGRENWASVTADDIKDIFKDYRYIYSLEKYADHMRQCSIDIHKRKQELLMRAFKSLKVSQNRRHERQYLINMLRMSRHKLADLISIIFFCNAFETVMQVCYNKQKDDQYSKYTWKDVFREHRNSSFVLFGAGVCCHEYLQKANERYKPKYIVDNDCNKWGERVGDLAICSPEALLKEKNVVVIITNVKYADAIHQQLADMNICNYAFVYLERNRTYYRLFRKINRLK